MSKLLKNSTIYTIVLILQNATSFLLLPLYTKYLTPEDYGITAVVGSVVSILSIFFTLSLNGAANRYYFIYNKNSDKLKRFWGTLFVVTVLNSFILTIILILFKEELIYPFVNNIGFYPYVFLGLISVALNPAFLFYQSCIQATQDGKKFALQNFLFFLLNLILTIILVTIFNLGASGVLLARAVTNLVFFIITLILFLPKIKIGINREDLLTGFKYSLPLIPHSLFSWTYSTIDRIIINKLKNTSEVGLYNIGAQFGLIMGIMTDSVNKAYTPWFFEQLESGEKGKEQIISVSSFLISIYSFLALGLALFSPELVILMTSESFHSSWITIPIIAFSYVFGGIYYVVCNSLFVRKTYIVPFVTLISAVLSVVFNLLLIPKLGMIGAAVSGLISQFAASIVVLIVSMRVVSVKYKWIQMYSTVLSFLLISFISYILKPWSLISLVIKIIVIIIASLILLKISTKQFDVIKTYIKSLKK